MLVREIMTVQARSIESSAFMAEAAEVMRESDVGILPVLEGGRPTGMVTDRDLVVRGVAEGKDPERTTVRELMTPRAVFVFADQSEGEAAQLMEEQQVRRLLVLDHDHALVGIVSASDFRGSKERDEQGTGVVNRAANIWPAERDRAG